MNAITGFSKPGIETAPLSSQVSFGPYSGYLDKDTSGKYSFAVSFHTEDKYEAPKDSPLNAYNGEPVLRGVSVPVNIGTGDSLLVDTSREVVRKKSVALEYPARVEFFSERGFLQRVKESIIEISYAEGELNHNRGEWNYRVYTSEAKGGLPQLVEFTTVFANSRRVLYGKLREIRSLREVKPIIAGEEISIVEDPKGTLLGYGYFIHSFQIEDEKGLVKTGKESAVFLPAPQDIINAGESLRSVESIVEEGRAGFYNLPFAEVNNLQEKVASILDKLTARKEFGKLYSGRK